MLETIICGKVSPITSFSIKKFVELKGLFKRIAAEYMQISEIATILGK